VQVFCREVLGFAHVFDTNFGRELALREHIAEFEERRAGAAKSSASENNGNSEQHLPMLASACPGWICYAEKAHAEMLPFISQTKSPQQVMGTLVKTWMAKKWGKAPDGVYHVTVMPCYDKKLEASRKDFYDEVYATRDVDCVITTGELELLMHEKGWDLSVPIPGELDPPPYPSKSIADPDTSSIILPELPQHTGTSSGSYLHGIISHLQETSATPLTLNVKMIRNADYEEYTLTDGERVVFRGAKCYGFRNLQNIVRKVGRERGVRTGAGAAGRLGGVRAVGGAAARRVAGRKGMTGEGEDAKYEYVEVMACPGGCVNGGGQLKGKVRDEESYERDWSESGVKWGDKEWTKRVEEAYWSDQLKSSATAPSPSYHTLVEEVRCQLGSDALRTEYRAVESEVIGLAVKW
jgi:iron only hydrogenase large subunit-like protein